MAIGEIQVGDLPTMSAAEFTANDYIFMIDNGRLAKKISRPDFFSVVQALVKGEKGDRGAVGATGERGATGAKGDKGDKGDRGATGAKGDQGIQGLKGDNGWSPVLSVVFDGDRRVFYLSDWIGGNGSKPVVGMYIGASSLVSDISLAVDVRGSVGLTGATGAKGEDGQNGIDAKQISSIEYQVDNSIVIKFTDATEIQSDTPRKITGWATYRDDQYTQSNQFSVNANTQVVVPNNGAIKTETQLPSGVSALYNATNQKITPSNAISLYGVRVRFKAVNSGTASDFITLSIEKATTDIPFTDDKILRPDVNPQSIDVSTLIYSDSTAFANGLTVRLKTGTLAIKVYDVEFIVSKLT